jgi:hypothetical protein
MKPMRPELILRGLPSSNIEVRYVLVFVQGSERSQLRLLADTPLSKQFCGEPWRSGADPTARLGLPAAECLKPLRWGPSLPVGGSSPNVFRNTINGAATAASNRLPGKLLQTSKQQPSPQLHLPWKNNGLFERTNPRNRRDGAARASISRPLADGAPMAELPPWALRRGRWRRVGADQRDWSPE